MSVTSHPSLGFCGSRSLPISAAPLIWRCVQSAIRRGFHVTVGCATGADGMALAACVTGGCDPSRLTVLAIGDPSGFGFWSRSAWVAVSAAVQKGASVRWWAGGTCNCASCAGPEAVAFNGGPTRCATLTSRLVLRTHAWVAATSAGGPGSGVVAFLSSPRSRGSIAGLRRAAAAGLPVAVFCIGFGGDELTKLGVGRWVLGAGPGVWSGAWRWVPGASDETPAGIVPPAIHCDQCKNSGHCTCPTNDIAKLVDDRINRAKIEGPDYKWAPEKDGTWEVGNPRSGRSYTVSLETCSCPDWEKVAGVKDIMCKHQHALLDKLAGERARILSEGRATDQWARRVLEIDASPSAPDAYHVTLRGVNKQNEPTIWETVIPERSVVLGIIERAQALPNVHSMALHELRGSEPPTLEGRWWRDQGEQWRFAGTPGSGPSAEKATA